MTATTYTTSLASGEAGVVILPKRWRGDGTRPAVIWAHGAGQKETALRDPTAAGLDMMAMIETLVAELGVPVISGYLGGDQWGNAGAQTKVGALVTLAQSTYGAKAGGVGLIGYSMGHQNLANWAAGNRSKALCLMSCNGVVDLDSLYAQTAHTASINAAYGGAYNSATMAATYSPTVNAATKFGGLPWMGYTGSSDTTCLPALSEAFAAAIGPTASITRVPGGHAMTTVAGYDVPAVVEFHREHLGLT